MGQLMNDICQLNIAPIFQVLTCPAPSNEAEVKFRLVGLNYLPMPPPGQLRLVFSAI